MNTANTAHRYPFDLSVVLPVYNEEDNIRPVHDELTAVLDGLPLRYEIIYVDDGSRDSSRQQIIALAEAQPETVRAVLLRRNFGQTAAIQAGIDHANGAIIALMDADLQNDPHDIPLMLEQMETEGRDLVSGWRKNRQDRALSRRLPSKVANRMISFVTGVELHDYGCTLKTYRREVLDHVRLYGEMHRFIPVLATEIDFVCNKGDRRCYVQSAYAMPDEAKREQEKAPLVSVDDSFRKVVVVRDPVVPRYDDAGVLVIGVIDFLLDPESLGL